MDPCVFLALLISDALHRWQPDLSRWMSRREDGHNMTMYRLVGDIEVEVVIEPSHPDGEPCYDTRIVAGELLESTRTRFLVTA